jgi:hypothetical protein
LIFFSQVIFKVNSIFMLRTFIIFIYALKNVIQAK